jgi:hypothetical protein
MQRAEREQPVGEATDYVILKQPDDVVPKPPPDDHREHGNNTICAMGPLFILAGAVFFAGTNAASTAYFRRGGTVVTLYLIRCTIVHFANGALVAIREGRAAAIRVMLLQTGRWQTSQLIAFRSLVFSTMSLFMCFGYILLTFSNAFTVMKGVDMLSCVLITRFLMGSDERLSWRELACGLLTLAGITLVAQPAFIFGRFEGSGETAAHIAHRLLAVSSAPPPTADEAAPAGTAAADTTADPVAGFAVASLAGVLSASVGVLTRVVSQVRPRLDQNSSVPHLQTFDATATV